MMITYHARQIGIANNISSPWEQSCELLKLLCRGHSVIMRSVTVIAILVLSKLSVITTWTNTWKKMTDVAQPRVAAAWSDPDLSLCKSCTNLKVLHNDFIVFVLRIYCSDFIVIQTIFIICPGKIFHLILNSMKISYLGFHQKSTKC